MDNVERSWGNRTILIHGGDAQNPSTAVSSPIYQSATFRFSDPVEML